MIGEDAGQGYSFWQIFPARNPRHSYNPFDTDPEMQSTLAR
jgi:hypothetical protein